MYQNAAHLFGRPNVDAHSSVVHRKEGMSREDALVGRPQLFAGVLPGDYTKILAAARVKEFTRGQMMFIESDSVQQVFLITSGLAKVTHVGRSGTEVILRFSVPGDVLGAAGLLSTGRHGRSVRAFRLCRALVWDAVTFRSLAERYQVLHQNMARILGDDLLELEERFGEVATERVGPRVARQLVRLREQIGRPVNGAVEIGLSREELAQMTGTTLFTVIRLLSAWEALGIVIPGRETVTICDVQSLRAICGVCPEYSEPNTAWTGALD